jgi:excisionase family DNA binding protein
VDDDPVKRHLETIGPILTVEELGRYLRVHTSTIYRLVERSELPAFKVGKNWRFNLKEIEQFMVNLSTRRAEEKKRMQKPRKKRDQARD